MTAPPVVWSGAKALRRHLVAIADLEPFPGNPRRGDVPKIRESLERFGQVRPILVDGGRIVAGHHLVLAATELGWTHVAVLAHDFGDENEQRAYLLADNRTAELGTIDADLLDAQLRALRESAAGLDGTGYSVVDADQLQKRLQRLRDAAVPPGEFPTLDPDDLHIDYRCPNCGHGWSGNPRPAVGAPSAE